MKLLKASVIANSSFGWWAAFLGSWKFPRAGAGGVGKSKKVIVAPRKLTEYKEWKPVKGKENAWVLLDVKGFDT